MPEALKNKKAGSGTKPARSSAGTDVLIFVHASGSRAIGPETSARLGSLGFPVYSHRPLAGCQTTRHDLQSLGPLLVELREQHPDQAVLLLHADLHLDAQTLAALIHELPDPDQPRVQTVLSHFAPAYNPLAGLNAQMEPPTDGLVDLVDLLGTGQTTPLRHWPAHCALLSPAAVVALATPELTLAQAFSALSAAGGSVAVCDRHFALAPGRALLSEETLQPHEARQPPPWGSLSARLQAWLDSACPALHQAAPLPRLHATAEPVTLHITHSWGGGVAQWIASFIEADATGLHLQLRSEGPQSGRGHGQRFSLYAGTELSCALASWWLPSAIQSVDTDNPHYAAMLTELCQRYGVGRVLVSSLVGHSLDALRTGLPTVQVLHDYFPLWPLLSVHPDSFAADGKAPDLAAALAAHQRNCEFPDRDALSWQTVHSAYFEALDSHAVQRVAPDPSVIELTHRLDERSTKTEIALIPHGYQALPDVTGVSLPIAARKRRDQRLRLLIPGRIQAGKGQQLLRDSLPELTEYAQVYLLGTGKSGEAFFGMAGVNVITQYAREDLPALIAEIGPHAAALLSVVPETFSYTLSELQQLGIPVIATKVGSLATRLADTPNSWLIEPTAAALVRQVAQIAAEMPTPVSVVTTSSAQPLEMVSAYNSLCPVVPQPQIKTASDPGINAIQAAAMAFQATREQAGRQRAEQHALAMDKEVAQRTRWALDTQRELEFEQQRRERWVARLQAQIDAQLEEIHSGAEALAETRQALNENDITLRELRKELDHLRGEHHMVLSSSSWRLTRPLRVLRRALENFLRARAWNPLRWPLLVSGLVRNLSTVGWRGTIMRLQYSAYQTEPETLPLEPVEDIGDPEPPARLPRSSQPQVSIVIPVFNNWAYTAACLRSIADTPATGRIEVIVVDDQSSDATADMLPTVEGLRVVTNPVNSGFIDSCNSGAQAARGEFLLFLNNDTQVLEGWLDQLLDTFENIADAGLVGSRLLYPDGQLQECGGIVFNDGSGWNYGRLDRAERPEYQTLRAVDYCSGACLMIRNELFQELGGFDSHYRPAYYEDTDLAFKVRAAGLQVLVQPASRVIHHEGISSGTDVNAGTKRYQQINQQKFQQRWADELASHPARIEDPTNQALLRAARDHRLRGRILIIDATTPEPDQDSGSLRLRNLMKCLLDLGFGVTFMAENHGHAGRYTRALQNMGVEVVYAPWVESNHAFFRQRGADFDHVMISRHYVAAQFVPLVRRYCPQAALIFDTVDLHYLREQRLADLENSLPLQRVAAQTRRSELAVVAQADAVLVVSPVESEVLASDAPEAHVHVLSNVHEVPGRRVEFAARRDLFFVGGYQHPPNVDAAQWFVSRIWPLIHAELPKVRFHLIGSKAPESVRSLKGDGVVFHGFVEDLDHYLDHCRLAVAPLRYGAGVKGKVNMSMSHGQPVVATPMAIEGIHAQHDREVLVAETEQDFANEVIRLYRDEALWQRISDAGIANVEANFSMQAARDSIEELLGQLEEKRKSV